MSDEFCDVCYKKWSWGCGHTGTQERDARRHAVTKKHLEGRCWHYNHRKCPKTCRLHGTSTPGYIAFHDHGDVIDQLKPTVKKVNNEDHHA